MLTQSVSYPLSLKSDKCYASQFEDFILPCARLGCLRAPMPLSWKADSGETPRTQNLRQKPITFCYQNQQKGQKNAILPIPRDSEAGPLQDNPIDAFLAPFVKEFQTRFDDFDAKLANRKVKEVLEDDQIEVRYLTQSFVALLSACCERSDSEDGLQSCLEFLKNRKLVTFTGSAFNGAEAMGQHFELKVHLFPPDSDETLWHNHGQSFFGTVIGKHGRYWHRQGEIVGTHSCHFIHRLTSCFDWVGVSMPTSKTKKPGAVAVFKKQAEGDPKLALTMPGDIRVGLAHSHGQGSMYFIAAATKHTVKAERGSGAVLTCVVQGKEKTNNTQIFKTDTEPITGNFAPREKHLAPDRQASILKSILAELAKTDVGQKIDKHLEQMLKEKVVPTCFAIPDDQVEQELAQSAARWNRRTGEQYRRELFQVIATDHDINTRKAIGLPEKDFKKLVEFMGTVVKGEWPYPLELQLQQNTQRDQVASLLWKEKDIDKRRGHQHHKRNALAGERVVEFLESRAGLSSPVYGATSLQIGQIARIISTSRVVPGLLAGKLVKIRSIFVSDEVLQQNPHGDMKALLQALELQWPDHYASYFLQDLEYSNADGLLLLARNSQQENVNMGLLERVDLLEIMAAETKVSHERIWSLVGGLLDWIVAEVLPKLKDAEKAMLRMEGKDGTVEAWCQMQESRSISFVA
eukprot:TRINITY_DN101967_c0_g1_i1.p1 TRINITY_DN101967_c0_g1~~TRINITY_DN101967_c0_g1_i1.p1  ORF type:complete len:690 (-),score=105.13 TRINITY_DN101967_c0_g1_i1:316-2385(-)